MSAPVADESPKTEFEQMTEAGPPLDGPFWERYNARLEFPIGAALSVLAHVLVVFAVVAALSLIQAGPDKTPVPVMPMDGDDDTGVGMAGGAAEPLVVGQAPMNPDFNREPSVPLEQVKEELNQKLKLDDPTANLTVSDANAAALNALDSSLLTKIMGIGQKKGDGQPGVGDGGVGADSTRARGLRWVLKFKTTSGRDYLNQLNAMKAVVLVPVPPDNKKMLIFRDLVNPKATDYASDGDLGNLSSQIQFNDARRDSCEAIAQALDLKFVPTAFWAFFPKGLEADLARLETAYQNKRPEDVKETVYNVVIRGGQPTFVVYSQRLKQ